MKKNYERIEIKKNNKTYDLKVMKNQYYELRDQIALKNQYDSIARSFNSSDHIEKKIDSLRYSIYKTINNVLKNGSCTQINNLALSFLEDEVSTYEVKLSNVRKKYYGKNISYLSNQEQKYYNAKKLITKLKEDALEL